jgi:hypothetical protein
MSHFGIIREAHASRLGVGVEFGGLALGIYVVLSSAWLYLGGQLAFHFVLDS